VIEEVPDEEASTTADEGECHHVVMAAGSVRTSKPEAELYDPGASRRMSPYNHRFETYQAIPPRAIMATDERVFYDVGIGDLRIEVPHGESNSVILLRDVLHAPNMGMTIVLIGRIAKAGCTVSFKGGSCHIAGPGGRTIGMIPAQMGYTRWHDLSAAAVEHVNLPTSHAPPQAWTRLQPFTPSSVTASSTASS
jgi:hypothetical protein